MNITETACLASFFNPTWTSWSTIWYAISALGTLFAASMIFIASNQLKFNAWIQIQDKWNNPEQRKLRKAIFERRERGETIWTDDQIEDAKNVCGRMDEFARLVNKFSDEKEIIEIWYVPISKLWDVLEEIVVKERVIHRLKWDAFESLATKCLKRRKRDN